MPHRSLYLSSIWFFAALVFLAKFPIFNVPLYWDEMAWASQARWLSQENLLRAVPGLRAPDAFRGHPPGLHLTFAILAKIFGYSIILSHLIPVCFAFIGLWFCYRLGSLLYDAKVGVFAALFLFLSPMYFAQSGMFLADLPVASLGIASIFFALRGQYRAYLLVATYMVFVKETSIAVLVALLLYLFSRIRPKTKEDLFCLAKYSIPLCLIGLFFVWQKLMTGHFFFIYPPSFDIKLSQVTPALIFQQAVWVTEWLFVHQHRYIFSALIVLNLIINRKSRRRSELWLFLLICVFSGYSFSVLFFLPRYLLPVLPYVYLLGAWSLFELVRSARLKTPTGLATLVIMVWSLATQPFWSNAEFNLRYLNVVRIHKEMCEFAATEFPDSHILTAWPHTAQLDRPHLGYVEKALKVTSRRNRQDPDLILVSTVPITGGMQDLRTFALNNDWELIKRLEKEPIVTELYKRRD